MNNKKYKVLIPAPQFGEYTYRSFPVTEETVYDIRSDIIDEFVKWAYVRGIDFSFMGKITEDGKSDVPIRLEKIKNDFWKEVIEVE